MHFRQAEDDLRTLLISLNLAINDLRELRREDGLWKLLKPEFDELGDAVDVVELIKATCLDHRAVGLEIGGGGGDSEDALAQLALALPHGAPEGGEHVGHPIREGHLTYGLAEGPFGHLAWRGDWNGGKV